MLYYAASHEAAINANLALATEPGFFPQDTSSELAIDWDSVTALVGNRPDAVQSMAISMQTAPIAGRTKAYIDQTPLIKDGVAYTPHIVLSEASHRSLRGVNEALRHELRHTVQEDRIPTYNRPGILPAIQLAGYAGLYLSMSGNSFPEALLTVGSAVAVVKPATEFALHTVFDHQELDAIAFAARTRSRPIYRP